MIDQKWIETCATAGEFLYGHYPVSILQKLYKTKKGYTISRANLIAAMQQSDAVLMEYLNGELTDTRDYGEGFYVPFEAENTELEPIFVQADQDGNPYASLHFNAQERTDLLIGQDDVDFYIPTAKEIQELVEKNYIRTPAMTALEKEIEKRGGDSSVVASIWSQYSTDKMDTMEAISAILNGAFHNEEGSEDKSDAAQKKPDGKVKLHPTRGDLNALFPLINNYLNNINLRARRGWRPDALFKMSGPLSEMPTLVPGSVGMAKALKEAEPRLKAMGAKVDYSSIDSFTTVGAYGEKKRIKVGRNDPCPCGSGLKYKRCHGKKRG